MRLAVLLILLMGYFIPMQAQVDPTSIPNPQFFKIIPAPSDDVPDWALLMYGEDPNIYEVAEAYLAYYEATPFVKTIHTQNYKYWIRQIEPYVNEEGFVRPPTRAEEDARFAKLASAAAVRNRKTGNWSCIGPFETYEAGSMIPYSNQVNVYALDQSDSHPDILYAGSEGGAIYKSTDRGLNWTPLTYNEVFSGGFQGLEIHPTDPDIVLTAVNNRIYRTADGGSSWTEVKYLDNRGYEIKYRPSNPDSVFCAGQGGLWLSTDGGITWPTQIFTEECFDVDWHLVSLDTVYLLKKNTNAVRAELYMSPDGGVNWILKDNGYYQPSDIGNAHINGGKIALTAANPDRIYVCLIGRSKADDDGWIGIVRSDDGGENWTNPAGQYGGPYGSINGDPMWNVAAYSDGYHQGFYNFDCEASQTNADTVWIGTVRLSESGDGGVTFRAIGAANSQRLSRVHADIQDIEVNGSEVWVANDGGIEYSADALQTTIESRKKGIAGSDFWGFGSGWNEDILVGGLYHNGNAGYLEGYGAGNSTKLGGVEEATGYVHPQRSRLAFFNQYWSGGLAMREVPATLGGGYTTYDYLPLIPNESYWESNSSGLYFDPRYTDHHIIGQGSSIWKSTDAGLSYQSLHDFGTNGRTLEIAISHANADYIYVVFKPNSANARKLFRTTDGGATWTELTTVPASNLNKLEISLNPENEDELWVLCADGSNGQKVYQSIDGGQTWINKTTNTLNGQDGKDICFQGGTDQVVYLVTDQTVFYYDLSTNNWIDYGAGLPIRTKALQLRPFYRDNKLRLATGGHAIWESNMTANSRPIAQPMTLADSVYCSRDTVSFDSYSIVKGTGTTYQWTFSPAPSWISSTTVRNPQVVFGANGNYTVTLQIMDDQGQSSSKTINDMVKVESRCEAEGIAGQALSAAANNDYFVASQVNWDNLTHFTVSGWWKPNGSQQAYSALFSDGQWCAHCEDTEGLIFDYYGNKLWYKWPGDGNPWASNSGIDIPLDEWSYVALVIEPTGATLYLNEEKYVHSRNLDPGSIASFHIGRGHYSKALKGNIDEVTVWKRALTETEIRELRHLTKAGLVSTDEDLLAYYQFNEIIGTKQIMDVGGTSHGGLTGSAALTSSAVPVGAGIAYTQDLLSTQYNYPMPTVGVDLTFSDCDSPNGQLVVSRLNTMPDVSPNTFDAVNNYWVVNYYDGESSQFDALENIQLTPSDVGFITALNSAEDAIVHKRTQHGEGENWTTTSAARALNSSTLTFDRASNIDGPLQLTLSNSAPPFDEMIPAKYCEVDTVPGQALYLAGGDNDRGEGSILNLNTNTFTTSAWIKPAKDHGTTGLLFWRGGSTTSGIHLTTGNEVRYHWDGGKWSWQSGASAPVDEWTHVALVVEPNQATIYVNGTPYVNPGTHNVEAFDTPFLLGDDTCCGGRNFQGEFDEVAVWDRALTQSEVRELMHLTKEDIIGIDANLQVYLQFNENEGAAYDKTPGKDNMSMLGNTERRTSTAPVGGGSSARQTVAGDGEYTFGDTGVSIDFPAAGTYPNGEIVVSRINLSPDTTPDDGDIVGDAVHWIIHNYGTNSTFSELDKITFNDVYGLTDSDADNPGQFALYKRGSTAHGTTWGTSLDNADQVIAHGDNTGTVEFSTGNGLTSFSQFTIGDSRKVNVSVRAILEGPFNNGMMTDELRLTNAIPNEQPYSGHVGGGGDETFLNSVKGITGNDAIVDWVKLELRDATDPAVILYTRAALLQRDGDIVDVDGSSPVNFRQAAAGNYYVALQHRNHLGIMTANTVSLSSIALALNFSDGSAATYGANAQKDTGGTLMLYAGDANANGQIQNTDVENFWKTTVGQSGYQAADFNLNGQVQNTDLENFWKNNVGRGTQVPQ